MSSEGTAGLPAWRLEELCDLFEVEPLGDGAFRGATCPSRVAPASGERAIVDGSQVLGQAIVACRRTEPERSVKSLHMIFSRPVLAPAPVDLVVETSHAGRSFASLLVTASQSDRLCARGIALLDGDAPDLVHHGPAMPDAGDPQAGPVYDELVDGREVRIAGDADYRDPEIVAEPLLDIWVRYAAPPEDPAVRQALLAQFCGRHIIGTAMRPHPGLGEGMAHRTVSTGVLTLTVRFHADRPLDGWLLYHHDALHAGRGLCDGKGRIFHRDGTLLASFEQEGMLRALPDSAAAAASGRENVM